MSIFYITYLNHYQFFHFYFTELKFNSISFHVAFTIVIKFMNWFLFTSHLLIIVYACGNFFFMAIFFLSVIFLVKQYTCLVAQLCLTLCDPMDCGLPGSSVHGILHLRTLEWVAMPSPGDLPNPGIKPRSTALQEDSLPSEPAGKPYYFSKCNFSCQAIQI